MAIIYGVFTFANFLAPSVVAVLGSKWTLVLCAIPYCLFIGAIIHPFVSTVYGAAALLGLAAGPLWVAQGQYLSENSDKGTIGRNSGLFWALLESSLVIGNLFVFLYLPSNINDISTHQRTVIYGVFATMGVIGVLLFVVLGKRDHTPEEFTFSVNISKLKHEKAVSKSPAVMALKNAFHLLQTREMLLVSLCSFYTGFSLTFFSSVYDTAVGDIEVLPKFGPKFSKRYVALTGLIIGVGEILGGLLFGMLGKRFVQKGRDPVIILGLVTHIICFGLVFLSMPSDSPHGAVDSLDKTPYELLLGPSIYVSMIAAFLLGFGDSCFNTQLYSFLGEMYADDSAPGFALYKFFQSLATAISFFYSHYLDLQYQLLILVIFAVIGSVGFINVEWSVQRRGGYQAIK